MQWEPFNLWKWHHWFAWRPVRLNYPSDRMVWLEMIERRKTSQREFGWEYQEQEIKNGFKSD